MLHRLRRVRFPPSLEGYGPGRPSSSAAALAVGPSASGPASPSNLSSSPPTSSPSPLLNAERPVRQKMPLGSDRRDEVQSAPVAGPSTTAPPEAGPVPTTLRAAADSSSEATASSSDAGSESPSTFSRQNTAAPPLTVIHAALEHPNPPTPRELLSYVHSAPQTYSVPAAAALALYAKRVGDLRTQRGASDLLKKLRIPAPHMDVRHEPANVELVDGWRRLAGIEPNLSLLKRWPPRLSTRELEQQQWTPRMKLVNEAGSPRPTPVLSGLHYLYLANEGMPLNVGYRMIKNVGGRTQHELALLHLHLAYTSEPPLEVVDAFAQLSTAPLSRQTVHLAVLALLRQRTTAAAAAATTSMAPSALAPILPELRALLRRFESHVSSLHRTPGPETWRHVGAYALATDDEQLARLAFVAARYELAKDAQRVACHPSRAAPPARVDHAGWRVAAPVTLRTPVAPATALAGQAAAEYEDEDLPRARFFHLGRRNTRWERMLHQFAARGWARRISHAEQALADAEVEAEAEAADADAEADASASAEAEVKTTSLMQRWDWLGRAGEGAARARAAALGDDTTPTCPSAYAALTPSLSVLGEHSGDGADYVARDKAARKAEKAARKKRYRRAAAPAPAPASESADEDE